MQDTPDGFPAHILPFRHRKQDTRHLSKSEFETVLSDSDHVRRPVEGGLLADNGGDRSDLWHLQNGGIKATEKAAQKAGKLCLMTGLPSFFEKFYFPVYKCVLSVLIDRGKSAPPSERG